MIVPPSTWVPPAAPDVRGSGQKLHTLFMGGSNRLLLQSSTGAAKGGHESSALVTGLDHMQHPPLPHFLPVVEPTGGGTLFCCAPPWSLTVVWGPSKASTSRKRGMAAAPSRGGDSSQEPRPADVECSETERKDSILSKKVTAEDDMLPPAPIHRDQELVERTILTFNGPRRRLVQIDDATDGVWPADLDAGAIIIKKGLRMNVDKALGSTKGEKIGNFFFLQL